MTLDKQTIKVLRTSSTATMPRKAYPGKYEDTAYDLFTDKGPWLVTSRPQAVSTGIRLIIPEGYWVKFAEKSGKGLKGLQVHGGIIDQSYTGELKIIVSCHSEIHGEIILNAGDSVCQFTLEKLIPSEIIEISKEEFNTLGEARLRGENGFGSSQNSLDKN